MVTIERWREAQSTEPGFFAGMAIGPTDTLDVLYHNAAKARHLSRLLKETPRVSVEIGPGPWGLGISGFLRDIPIRLCVEPDPRLELDPRAPFTPFINEWRRPVQYVVGIGENIPLADKCSDLVICCNVIDHAFRPDKILGEIARILKPGGLFFFDVDTFSVLGLLKWYTWTKRRRKHDLLVIAHTYRMFEPDVSRRLKAAGFTVLYRRGHNLLSLCVGHFRTSTFFLKKAD
ncbi:MAG: class I SAM-dependent methyltransferase [Candidatus Acidiferrales bacterium]